MENQTKKGMSTAAKIGIAAAVVLVLIIVIVNVTGISGGNPAQKAFKEAFIAQNNITDEFYNAHPEEKKIRELAASDHTDVVNAKVVQVGETGSKLLNMIVPKVELNAEIEKAGSDFNTGFSFDWKEKSLLSGNITAKDGNVVVSMPQVWQENYSLDSEGETKKDIFNIISSLSLKKADRLGREASSYFLTLLKFAEYEENENGTVDFTVAEERLTKALDFAKKLIGEKLDAADSFPIDVNSLKINEVKGNISFKEDGSLNDSILSCRVEFALKEYKDNIKTAVFTAGIDTSEKLEAFAEIDFGGESMISAAAERNADENGYEVILSGYIASAFDKNAVEIHKSFPKDNLGERFESVKYLRMTDGIVRGYEVQSAGNVSLENEDAGEKVIITSPETYILLLNNEGNMVPVVKLDTKREMISFNGEIVLPEAKSLSSLSQEEISDIKKEAVKNVSANALAAVLGK